MKTREQLLAEREAKLAEVAAKYDAKIAAMDADREAIDRLRDALDAIHGISLDRDKMARVVKKAALPLAPRAVMGDAEIEALAWQCVRDAGYLDSKVSFETAVAIIRATLANLRAYLARQGEPK